MERHEICTDFLHIIAGTSNPISRAYTEAATSLNDNDKAIKYLKNFIMSIENVASKSGSVDGRISSSKGNMKDFSGYNNIEKSLKFLATHKTPTGNAITADLKSLHDSLEKYQTYYTEGYNKHVRLIVLEYECAMYLLVTGLSMALAFCFDVTEASGTTKIVPKAKAYFGVTGKKISEMANELKKKDHEDYIDQLLKTANQLKSGKEFDESVYTEGVVETVGSVINLIGATFNAVKHTLSFGAKGVKTIKNSLFGIVPLIRSVIYLSYKRKADTVLALEQNISFLEQNIEILNRKVMDPEKKKAIIDKQKAQIEAYQKKAEKLRAQLSDGEREASDAIKKEDPKMSNTDDDFVLESVENGDVSGGDV